MALDVMPRPNRDIIADGNRYKKMQMAVYTYVYQFSNRLKRRVQTPSSSERSAESSCHYVP